MTQSHYFVAALLEKQSPTSRVVLEQAAGDLLNSQTIKLADNVFTNNSTVYIEAIPPQNSQGDLLNGREIRAAITLSLLFYDKKCYLRHDQSGEIEYLNQIKCKAI
ncbi:MAG: hypothetical protein ABJK37_18360 [Paraglaciecola sp.]|uniref:hypothetical protein n=1 Tax=Paraglaciecola sp. TaxID=1920173 RepID=UPI00329A7848